MDVEERSDLTDDDSQSRVRKLINQWDVLFFLIIFTYLTYRSFGLVEEGRQFPLVFLSIGILALVLELVIEVALPPKYADEVKSYLDGITGDVEQSFGEEMELEDSQEERESEISERKEALADQAGVTLGYKLRIGIVAAMICGYGLFSYLIGVFFAIPFFVFPTIYLVGSQRFMRALTVTVITMVSVYFLFGSWMNVPIFDGVLL